MSTPPTPVVGTEVLSWLIGLLVLVAGAYSTWRAATATARKANAESSVALIAEYRAGLEDLREELAAERAERKAAEAKLNSRLDAAVVRERLRDDYIAALRFHIESGKPPPPPAWPDGLLGGHHQDD